MPQSKPRTNVEAGSRAIYPVLPLRDIVVFPQSSYWGGAARKTSKVLRNAGSPLLGSGSAIRRTKSHASVEAAHEC